jgi:hypothetical protein
MVEGLEARESKASRRRGSVGGCEVVKEGIGSDAGRDAGKRSARAARSRVVAAERVSRRRDCTRWLC